MARQEDCGLDEHAICSY